MIFDPKIMIELIENDLAIENEYLVLDEGVSLVYTVTTNVKPCTVTFIWSLAKDRYVRKRILKRIE